MSSEALKRTKSTLSGMKQRCYNPKCSQFKNYGGRGIKVCDRWLESFQNFVDDMGLKPEGLSIDRINNDGDYEPGNCRWATSTEQRNNQRTCRPLTFNGITKPLRDWAQEYGIHEMTLHHRIVKGWDAGQAITTPVNTQMSDLGKKGCAVRHSAEERQDKADRLQHANALIKVISSHGRRFFYNSEEDAIARLEMDANKRIWFIDDYRGSRVFVSYRGEWRGFSHGGTLRSLIEAMRDYIRFGTPIHPERIAPTMSYGDMWGYGAEAAAAVRAEAHQLPIFSQSNAIAAAKEQK